MSSNNSFHCPYCYKKYLKKPSLYEHIEECHSEYVSDEFPPSRLYFNYKYKKNTGHCVICRKETQWNNSTERYSRFCSEKCKKKYVEMFQNRVIKVYGKTTSQLLSDPEIQKKMLSNRKISGKYKWSDGSANIEYTGSYELDFLKFLDIVMRFESSDIISPAPQIFYYNDNGNKRFYIPDFYIPSINTIVEIKDGEDNKAQYENRLVRDANKEKLKDEIMRNQTDYNFIKVVNKNYSLFLNFLMDLKENNIENKEEKIKPLISISEAIEIAKDKILNNKMLNEGIVNQVFMGLKVHPKQKLWESFKKHEYPGFLNLIERTKKRSDLIYLRKDCYIALTTIATIKEKMIDCEKGEFCKDREFIKNEYINKGITSKDIEKYEKWIREIALKEISNKLREIKKEETLNESLIDILNEEQCLLSYSNNLEKIDEILSSMTSTDLNYLNIIDKFDPRHLKYVNILNYGGEGAAFLYLKDLFEITNNENDKKILNITVGTNPKYRGLGYITTLFNQLLSDIEDFDILSDYEYIRWKCDINNEPSNEVAKKFDFKLVMTKDNKNYYYRKVRLYEENIIYESQMNADKRNSLDDSEFGLPNKRKYPLNDKKHVLSAIRLFNYVDEKDEKELSKNIIERMKKYNIPKDSVGEKNRLYKYLNEDYLILEENKVKNEFKTDKELFNWMSNNITYSKFSKLKSPYELESTKNGSCHDQVLYEITMLRKIPNISNVKAYFIIEYNDKKGGETHSVVSYTLNNKDYYLENAWSNNKGIHELKTSIPELFKEYHKNKKWGNITKYPNIEISSFKSKEGMTLQELVDSCLNNNESTEISNDNFIVVDDENDFYSNITKPSGIDEYRDFKEFGAYKKFMNENFDFL